MTLVKAASSSGGAGARRFTTEILPTDGTEDDITFAASSPASGSASALDRVEPRVRSPITERSLATCAAHLRAGELVAFPTETVYGLGANALDAQAVRKIYEAKNRPADNPLIVHVSDLAMLRDLVASAESDGDAVPSARDQHELTQPSISFGPLYDALIRRFWPGPLTLIFPIGAAESSSSAPASSTSSGSVAGSPRSRRLPRLQVPPEVSCGQPSLAVRMPAHPLARALIARAGVPLAAPSANASTRPSPTTAAHVLKDLGGADDLSSSSQDEDQLERRRGRGKLAYILDGGPANVGVESTVVDGTSTPGELRVLRPGGVTVEDLEACLGGHGLLLSETLSRSSNTASSASPPRAEAVRVRVYGKDLARSSEMEKNPTTPGMKYRHYSPSAPVILLSRASCKNEDEAVETLVEAVRLLAGRFTSTSTSRRDPDDGAAVTIGLMSLSDSGWVDELLASSSSRSSTDTDTSAVKIWLAEGGHAPALGPPFESESPDKSTRITVQPYSLGTRAEPALAGRRLFDGLRTLDEGPLPGLGPEGRRCRGCDVILVEAVSEAGIGLAVMNRLAKAARETVSVKVPTFLP